MQVRRIAAEDWIALRELRLHSLHDAPEAFGQTHANALAIADSEWQSNARSASRGDRRAWFIASDPEGRNVGLVQARRRPPVDCLVFSMWVAPRARRGGYGRALIDAVQEWSLGWGAQRIVLWVFGANEGAQRFYERLGFHFISAGPDLDSGLAYGALAMALEFPATDE